MESTNLCASCANSVWCDVWAEWKCLVKKSRMLKDVSECSDYKKAGKNFKRPKCQCEDCLDEGIHEVSE